MIRILTGMMLLYNHAIWGIVLDDFFGPDSWASRDLVAQVLEDQYVYTFWWYVPPRWIWLAYVLSMTVLFWFTIGLWTRISSILSVVVVISFAHRVPEALFGLDKIILMLTLYLAVGPSGKALSVDSWLARRRARDWSPAPPSRRRQFRVAAYSNSHVHYLLFRRRFQVDGSGLVERPGDVDGARKPRIPVDRHDVAGLASLGDRAPQPFHGLLGAYVLCLDLDTGPAPAGSLRVARPPSGDRRLHGPVDVFAGHVDRLRRVLAAGGRGQACEHAGTASTA